jgi:2,4-dienoyl-CoA reductase-like NADH-dependent reductase (Old Yellow Enzyme family)
MPHLFDSFIINGLVVPNRFVRSATVDNLGKDQKVSPAELDLYRELARGEVGLIISSGLFPSLDGWAAPGQVGIHRDEQIPSLSTLTRTVHRAGGRIIAQLMHAGWFGNPGLSGLPLVGPSATVNAASGLKVKGLSTQEVYQHADDFVQAGRRAREAGFDGVQVHAAHSWLVSAFLSPATNRRQDEWGGSPSKRTLFLVKIIEGLRRQCGPEFPILIKLGLKDYHPQGKSLAEGIDSARLFAQAGLDALEISEGLEAQPFHHIRAQATRPYYLDECRQAKDAIACPLIVVGGFRRLEDMQAVVEGGLADAISLCRPFIMDQHLVAELRSGDLTRSDCNSCNGCVEEMHRGTLHCVFRDSLLTPPSP